MYKKLLLILVVLFVFPIRIYANTKSIIDITNTDVYEIQEAIDKGYLTYETLIKLYLERIEEYNDEYNAVIKVNPEAVEIAKEMDEEFKENGRKSILFGIPIIVKDNIDYKEMPTTVGTKALKDSIPYENSVVVENLINSGAIIIGKANMSEFAFSAADSRSSYGNVHNAFNLDYSPFGSSGGSAVSVAASLALMGLGTDTNSSIRLPSSGNNVVGLRPTYGLLSLKGVVAYDVTRDTVGPITKSVSENAELLTILANNGIDYSEYLKKDGLKDKTIGVVTDFIEKQNSSVRILSGYYGEVEDLINEAVEVMKAAGADIVYLEDFYTSYYDSLFDKAVLGISMCYQFNSYIKNTSSKIKSYQELLNNGGYIQALSGYNSNCYSDITKSAYYDKVLGYKQEYIDYVDEVMEKNNLDVFLYPTSKAKTLTISETYYQRATSASYTIAPMTGMPAISVPMGFDSAGLPYGLELVAKVNQENILYEIAYAYEQKTNYNKNPDISPNLYDIPKNLNKLINYYEKNKFNEKLYTEDTYSVYITSLNDIKSFLENYNNENTDDINTLIKEYESSVENLELNDKNYIYYIIGIFIIMFLFMKYRKRKHKRRRV